MKQHVFSFVFLSYLLAIGGSGYASWYAFSVCKNNLEHLKENDISTKDKTEISVDTPGKPDELDLSAIREFPAFQDCIDKHLELNDKFDCSAKSPPAQAIVGDAAVADNDYMASNFLIFIIERLLIAGLAVQLFLTSYTLFLKKYAAFDKYIFHMSDWAINTPPILGVLANLVSFSLLISHENDIMSVFKGYFFQAVITTLIGGIFYIVNLALKVIIHPRVEETA